MLGHKKRCPSASCDYPAFPDLTHARAEPVSCTSVLSLLWSLHWKGQGGHWPRASSVCPLGIPLFFFRRRMRNTTVSLVTVLSAHVY